MRSAPQKALLQERPHPLQILIRPLTPDDVRAYRALRQHILDIGDGRCFSDSYIRERQLETESAWREWCTERPGHCILGTFDAGQIIGVMMITQYEAFGDHSVEWEAVWLDPRYRRLGIAKQAYQEAQQWTKNQGYRHVVSFIRADNHRALEIRRKSGARYFSTKRDEIWADGSIGDLHTFILDLRQPAPEASRQRTPRRIKDTLSFLRRDAPPASYLQDGIPSSHAASAATNPFR